MPRPHRRPSRTALALVGAGIWLTGCNLDPPVKAGYTDEAVAFGPPSYFTPAEQYRHSPECDAVVAFKLGDLALLIPPEKRTSSVFKSIDDAAAHVKATAPTLAPMVDALAKHWKAQLRNEIPTEADNTKAAAASRDLDVWYRSTCVIGAEGEDPSSTDDSADPTDPTAQAPAPTTRPKAPKAPTPTTPVTRAPQKPTTTVKPAQ